MKSKLIVILLMVGFPSISFSQNSMQVSDDFKPMFNDSILHKKINKSLDGYLKEKLGVGYSGNLRIAEIIVQSKEVFVIGEFKDASLYLGGDSTFNAYVTQQTEEVVVTEFCYNKYDEHQDKQDLRCLENSKKIKQLHE